MKVYIYILNTLADWEISYLIAELNSRRFLDKSKESIELIKLGNTLDPIKTMGGITITPDNTVDSVVFKDNDVIVLPGADTWFDESNNKIIDIISKIGRNVTVAAICGATMALAEKGLLNNIKHTSNDLDFLKMYCSNYAGEKYYLNQSAVVDDNLITASGLAPLEFTYEVIKKINVMKREALEAWYKLYKTKNGKYFHALMDSVRS